MNNFEASGNQQDDPVENCIGNVSIVRNLMTSQLANIYDGIGGDTKSEATQRLLEISFDLDAALENMLTVISLNMSAKKAVETISNVLKNHDIRMREDIGLVSKQIRSDWTQLPNDEVYRDYAIACVDIEDISFPVGERFMPMDRNSIVTDIHRKHREKLAEIIKNAPKNNNELLANRNRNKRIMTGGLTLAIAALAFDTLRRR